eukprot:SAG11_NODE_163_length_13928_cov_29.869188_2_plen_159_part_00
MPPDSKTLRKTWRCSLSSAAFCSSRKKKAPTCLPASCSTCGGSGLHVTPAFAPAAVRFEFSGARTDLAAARKQACVERLGEPRRVGGSQLEIQASRRRSTRRRGRSAAAASSALLPRLRPQQLALANNSSWIEDSQRSHTPAFASSCSVGDACDVRAP